MIFVGMLRSDHESRAAWPSLVIEAFRRCSMHATLLMSLAAVGACFALAIQPAVSGDVTDAGLTSPAGASAPAPTSPDSTSTSAPAAASGMTIHIDPQTGALTKEAAPTAPLSLSPAEQNAFSTSHQGLVETPSPVPGGGVMIDLQGRFQHPLSATIDDAGKLTIRHLDPTPGSGQPK
jgi:hypothetical protein